MMIAIWERYRDHSIDEQKTRDENPLSMCEGINLIATTFIVRSFFFLPCGPGLQEAVGSNQWGEGVLVSFFADRSSRSKDCHVR